MKASQIKEILDAQVLCGAEFLDAFEVESAFGADMMSDILAFYVKPTTIVLTGTINQHLLRTAEMLDLRCVLFVRGKNVPEEIVRAAREMDMILMNTDKTLFTSCGLLYEAGLRSCSK